MKCDLRYNNIVNVEKHGPCLTVATPGGTLRACPLNEDQLLNVIEAATRQLRLMKGRNG
jgi:hypothetical protein